MKQLPLRKTMRFKQIRFCADSLNRLSNWPVFRTLIPTIGKSTLLTRALVGYHQIFPDFHSAERYARHFGVPSHDHPCSASTQLSLSSSARLSDYPAMFYMQPLVDEMRSLLDIGGSAGNLFHSYSRYLKFRPDLRWTVFDVPSNIAVGRQLARERNESRLGFIDKLESCRQADVVLISGSLHYFDKMPAQLLRYLDPPPRHVIINRTPVTAGRTAITIQDARFYYAISPARILNRDEFMQSMQSAGYEVVDEWPVDGFSLKIPLNPKASATSYSGFYFKLK